MLASVEDGCGALDLVKANGLESAILETAFDDPLGQAEERIEQRD
jgi:hypothetical protein